MNELEKFNDVKVKEILKELCDAFYDIPFENSRFQTQTFVLEAAINPERAYRALGLRIIDKFQTLQNHIYATKKFAIDLEEKLSTLEEETNEFKKRKMMLDIEKLETTILYDKKLINDLEYECEYLYELFKKFPRYTREQFEDAEFHHYFERLKRDAIGISGSRESLFNMIYDKPAFENVIDKLATADPTEYPKIRQEMLNNVDINVTLFPQQNLVKDIQSSEKIPK